MDLRAFTLRFNIDPDGGHDSARTVVADNIDFGFGDFVAFYRDAGLVMAVSREMLLSVELADGPALVADAAAPCAPAQGPTPPSGPGATIKEQLEADLPPHVIAIEIGFPASMSDGMIAAFMRRFQDGTTAQKATRAHDERTCGCWPRTATPLD